VAARLVIGRDAELVRETPDGVELAGRTRLRPGFLVEVAARPEGRGSPGGVALVWTWRLHAVGSAGPIFRGFCRWHRRGGHDLPADTRAGAAPAENRAPVPGITLDEGRGV
jgi:hypothetical protein